jgi:uncharacterized protein (UPF0261 family)
MKGRPATTGWPAPDASRVAIVAGTFDTKGAELNYLKECLQALGIRVRTADFSTAVYDSAADVGPVEIAAFHAQGPGAVFTGDRGGAVTAMAEAFGIWIAVQSDLAGVISAGGSGGTTLATSGMRRLPVGVPKVMVSTVASGEVGHYVGPADIMMMYAVADVQGLNAITRSVLGNAAHALAGMIAARPILEAGESRQKSRPAVGITMFGVTTPCVQGITRTLGDAYDCLVFHATGTGGRSMEKLADSGLLSAILDITTTEVADMEVGGVLAADRDRFGAVIRTRIPYVGSVGAMDMVNFGPRHTVPERFSSRNLVVHNPNVTLMRTTPEENRIIGRWIAGRLNEMTGPVRFLLPLSGVSMIDAPGKPFHDPEADVALFDAIAEVFIETANRKLLRIDAAINDQAFIDAAISAFHEIAPRHPV